MTEGQYTSIRTQVFKKISNNRWNKRRINAELGLLREKRDKKMESYQGLNQTSRLEKERALLLEKSNYGLLEYEQALQKCDMYPKRAQLFLNCVISLSNHNRDDFKKYSTAFINEIKQQALEYKKMEIQQVKQKQIVYTRTKQLLKIVEQSSPKEWELWKEKEITKEQIDSENMKLFNLEEEHEVMKNVFQSSDTKLDEKSFYNTILIDASPLDVMNKICPDIKEQLLQLNEQRGKIK